jgi:DNA modification methylase
VNQLEILAGDCRAILPTLEAGSAQTCVTSPPYWGLRDYGTGQWEGGDAECGHAEYRSIGASTLRNDGREKIGTQSYEKTAATVIPYRGKCGKCGARRIDQQLGLESTPEEYIANMVAVFREVWRVLRDDGTLWLNLGDSYATGGRGGHRLEDAGDRGGTDLLPRSKPPPGLKPKDLCMMPARVALALQADGWYLRSDIIWHKLNPMPESVTDRPTKAHEYIFLLAKQERYFYDAEAIREPANPEHFSRYKYDFTGAPEGSVICPGDINGQRTMPKGKREFNEQRNKRSVWTIATQPYREAHFATFPEDLIKPCILAGSRVGDIVLDPFAGSGTVGQVALEFGRRAILIELNPDYIKLAQDRTWVTPGFPNLV